jgi:hypothetical protein
MYTLSDFNKICGAKARIHLWPYANQSSFEMNKSENVKYLAV